MIAVMARIVKILLPALFAAVALGACEIAAPRPSFPEIRYLHRPPIRLNVARVEIQQPYESPLKAPYVEHRFPIQPASLLRTWAKDRLKAVGRDGVARFVIRDASVTEEALKTKKGLRALFTAEQAFRYTGRVRVVLELVAEGGTARGFAEAVVTRNRTVSENMSLNKRQEVFFALGKAMGDDFDRVMEAEIRKHLKRYLR